MLFFEDVPVDMPVPVPVVAADAADAAKVTGTVVIAGTFPLLLGAKCSEGEDGNGHVYDRFILFVGGGTFFLS